MIRYPLVCVVAVSLTSPLAYSANLRLKVEGLSGQLEKNARVQLSTITTDEVVADGRFRARVEKAIKEGLRPLGYYEPVITFDYQDNAPPARPVLYARVVLGEPVKIAGVTVDIEGAAKTDPAFKKFITKNTPETGTVVNHGEYESFKSGLSGLALKRGYFDAEMEKSQLGIALSRHAAYWDFVFNSGKRYRFGKVNYQGSQISDEYLEGLVPFKEGDYYTSDQLAEFNRLLAETGWFQSAIVTPDIAKARADNSDYLTMDASFTPRAQNFVELGGGFATDVGPRVQAKWNKPWVNSSGHSLTSSISLSAPEQIIDTSYRIPLKVNPIEQYYAVSGGYKRTDLNDTKADTATVSVSRNWDLSTGWQYGINMRWSLSHFTQADITNTTMLLYPGVNVSRVRSRGGMMPSWGDSQRYSVDVSNEMWGSDVDFSIFRARNVWVRTPWDGHRFVMRGNLGWIETNNFDKVPPDLRFFAGGDGSIRGYRYNKISPEDADGKLTGGSRLVVGSLEYQYNVTGDWWGAVFVDSGEVVNDIKRSNFKTGAGVGVRWASPVGPIKFDLAAPVGDNETKNIQFYIGLGAEL